MLLPKTSGYDFGVIYPQLWDWNPTKVEKKFTFI
jgi:hypothetical protein